MATATNIFCICHGLSHKPSFSRVDLVIEDLHIPVTAISTFLHPPKWWFRYVDDSHSCLKKDQVDEFHKHLSSINPDIQFTLELEDASGQGLAFLDIITSRWGTAIQVDVSRKPTVISISFRVTLCALQIRG